jgi:pimeloyl-ACP methyl ester carboxylesterase
MAKSMEARRVATSDWAVRDVTVRGVRTRVVQAGADNEAALILVHGFLTSHHSFDQVIDAFATRFHVIAPDLPGFGDSEKPSPINYAYGIEAFTETVADLVAAFGVGRAAILGHSLGGAVALSLATEHAELVERLVLVDALCYPLSLGFRSRLPLIPILGSLLFKQLLGRRTFRAHFRSNVFAPDFPFPTAYVDQLFDAFNSPSGREGAYAVLTAALDTRAIVAKLPRVHVPTFVVWGRDDGLLPYGHGQRLAREIHGAKLEILDAGHAPHEEQPAKFVHVVTQFLEGHR